jgi:hypothetical protein
MLMELPKIELDKKEQINIPEFQNLFLLEGVWKDDKSFQLVLCHHILNMLIVTRNIK